MKQSWIDKKNREIQDEFLKVKEEIRYELTECGLFDNEDISLIFEELEERGRVGFYTFYFPSTLWDKYENFYKENCPDRHEEAFFSFYCKADNFLKKLPTEKYITLSTKNYNRYLDREMDFDGDILITDPCYIMKEEIIDYASSPSYWDYISIHKEVVRDGKVYLRPPMHEDYPDCKDGESPTLIAEQDAYHKAEEEWRNANQTDWERCWYGDNMEALGINHHMTRNTLYGDWRCTVFNSDTKEKIGSFCADAGLVSVFLLDEVLKYNPDYKVEEKSYSATVIRDFKGTVKFVVKKSRSTIYESFYVEVVGKGINKKSGEVINFIGKQTGF